jgi:hypothetical protein
VAWEWSHTPDAYENGRKNLAKLSISDLIVMKAEWEAISDHNEETFEGGHLDTDKYNKTMTRLQATYRMARRADVSIATLKEQYANEIWEKAEKLRTCTNGGHEAWVCPFGCHLVAW